MSSLHLCATTSVLATVLLLGGCAGGEDPEADPSAPASESSTPTAPPSETAAPATGPQLSTRNVSVRLPRGWIVQYEGADRSTALDKRGMSGGFFLSQSQHLGSTDLDDQAATTRRNMSYSPPLPQRRDDVTVDGVPGFVLSGVVGDGSYVYEYGAVHDGVGVSMTFFFEVPPREAEETIASIMASWKWT